MDDESWDKEGLIAALMFQLLTGKRTMELIRMDLTGDAWLGEVVALLGLEKSAK